jgi:hypothetical protein
MSNANNGPRNMSCSDYTRLMRLRPMLSYKDKILANADVTNPTAGPCVNVCNGFGIGKYRRSASDWTAYKASQLADQVEVRDRGQPGMGKILTAKSVCSCNESSPSNLMAKDHICIACKSLIGSSRIPGVNYSNSWPIPDSVEWRPYCSGYYGR